MSLQIERVETDRQLREFIKVAWKVYEADPHWVPWMYHERLDFFDKQKNPFFEHSEADYFIARRHGETVGSIAAILNHRHNQFHEENVAHFGVFEVLNDPEAAAALLEAACDWARARGVDKILGPMTLSTNDECGLLIDGFDSPPVVLMTYNPPYYSDFIKTAGFTKAMDLWAWHAEIAEVVNNMPDKVQRVVGKVRDRFNLTIQHLNLKDWDNEVALVKRIYNSAWSRNWGFVPMTDAEFSHLADGLKPVLDPAIAFKVYKGEEPVGFALSLPNVNEPLHRFRPKPSVLSSYLGGAYMLLNRYRTKGLRVLVLGVIEEFRGQGIDALLYYETAKAALARGYHWAEASWILEANDMMNRGLEMMGAKVYKTYRIYEKSLT
ncbi:MAG: N-acetyltransferase [Anaerolineae bacterium]